MKFRIVMIGARGERDYVEKILDDGCPCICGPLNEFVQVFNKTCAERIAKNLRNIWLGSSHVAVELEAVQ